MRTPFRRTSLPDAVAGHLREAIRKGVYGDSLPSERALAAEFGVSRPTLRAALSRLREAGLLKAQDGRPAAPVCTEEVAVGESAPLRHHRVSFLTPHSFHRLPHGVMMTYSQVEQRLSRRGLRMDFKTCGFFRAAHPRAATPPQFLRGPGSDVHVLHDAPEGVQRWFEKGGVRCVVAGTRAQGVSLPSLGMDVSGAAQDAVRRLRAHGHVFGRIVFLAPEVMTPDCLEAAEGFAKANGAAFPLLRYPEKESEWAEWIATKLSPDLLLPGGFSAVITVCPRFTAALVSCLGARFAIRIPEALSVICLADDPVLELLVPGVARYRASALGQIKGLSRLILDAAEGRAGREVRLLTPEFVPGGTVAKPR